MSRCLTMGFAGAGGDGVVMLGSLLQRLAALQGYYSQMPRYYEPQIRGGGSAVKLGIDTEMLSLPKDRLDLLLCFDWTTYIKFAPELQLSAEPVILYEKVPPTEVDLPPKSILIQIDFSAVSENTTGSARNKNIVALGLLEEALGLAEKGFARAIEENTRFSKLELLRRREKHASSLTIRAAMRRLERVRALGINDIDLTLFPAGRINALSRYGLTSWAAAIDDYSIPSG